MRDVTLSLQGMEQKKKKKKELALQEEVSV